MGPNRSHFNLIYDSGLNLQRRHFALQSGMLDNISAKQYKNSGLTTATCAVERTILMVAMLSCS